MDCVTPRILIEIVSFSLKILYIYFPFSSLSPLSDYNMNAILMVSPSHFVLHCPLMIFIASLKLIIENVVPLLK